MKTRILLTTILLLIAGLFLAQDDTTTDEEAGPQTTVEIFFVACEDLGVMNLNGFAQDGFDIFFQLYNGSNGTGETLTSLRRANVSGDYAFSERIPYRDDRRVAPLAIASARIIIAPTDTPEEPVYETTVDDIQDGCNDALNPLQSSDNAGDPVTTPTPTIPEGIPNPDGGILNDGFDPPEQGAVVIGPTFQDLPVGRTTNPGLVFALCDSFYPDAQPGLIYDSDSVRVYWYWFADSPERLQQNLSFTEYRVKLNQAPLDYVFASPVTQRGDAYYVFFTADVGTLAPGFYEVEFKQDWSLPVSDGFNNFGPGTGVPNIRTNCNFKVESDPNGSRGVYNNAYLPMDTPAHNFQRAIIEQQVIREYLEQRSNIGQPDSGSTDAGE